MACFYFVHYVPDNNVNGIIIVTSGFWRNTRCGNTPAKKKRNRVCEKYEMWYLNVFLGYQQNCFLDCWHPRHFLPLVFSSQDFLDYQLFLNNTPNFINQRWNAKSCSAHVMLVVKFIVQTNKPEISTHQKFHVMFPFTIFKQWRISEKVKISKKRKKKIENSNKMWLNKLEKIPNTFFPNLVK